MIHYLWGGMIIIGMVFAVLTGRMSLIADAAIVSAQDAVELCISMTGIMSMWVGMMEIARESGLVEKLSKMISPFLSFFFPEIPKNHKARDYISLNIIANLLGLGWAATPAGLSAMKEMENLRIAQGRTAGIATNAMCNFLILNISSLQLIPVSIIAYRSQFGSANPTAIIAPGLIATSVSTIVAIIYCKIKSHGGATCKSC